MRIALKSDFSDYYDHGFEAPHPTHAWLWERFARGGLAHPDRLAYLAGLGLRTPLHGSTRQLAERILAEQPPGMRARLMQHLDLVLSTDPSAHPGTPKVRMTMAEAIEAYPDHFAVEFIPANPEGRGESLRYLRIGRRQFWLGFASCNDWRSAAGDTMVGVLAEEKPLPEAGCDGMMWPLFAIDFVRAWGRGALYALNFTTAPALAGTGIERHLSAREVYEEIACALASPWASELAQAA